MTRLVAFRSAAFLALALSALAAPGSAKDLGVRGESWAIAEHDLLERIEARLTDMERSGELAHLQTEARAAARARLEEPGRIPGIAPARERRSWMFDPAVTVSEDIRAADGTLIAAAGTRIDPLRHAPLTRDLLFIDGTREAEVAWALGYGPPAKIVLLAGRPLDLRRRYGRPFFFDQDGRLAARFGLRFTPAAVTQDRWLLRITEVPLDDAGEAAR